MLIYLAIGVALTYLKLGLDVVLIQEVTLKQELDSCGNIWKARKLAFKIAWR